MTKYYDAVWIDFLHYGENKGKIAYNVQEVSAEGKVMETHRVVCDFMPECESDIVYQALRGAVWRSSVHGKDGR